MNLYYLFFINSCTLLSLIVEENYYLIAKGGKAGAAGSWLSFLDGEYDKYVN